MSMELYTEISNRRMKTFIVPRQANADLRRNFLYDIYRGRGVLVDFGLAEVILGNLQVLCTRKLT